MIMRPALAARCTLLPLCVSSFFFACTDDGTTESGDQVDTGLTPDSSQPADAAADAVGDGSALAPDVAATDGSTDALPLVPTDWRPEASDFDCLTSGRSVRGFWLSNPLGQAYEDEAVRIAEAGMVERLPAGTIIQLIPQEAMVKLPEGSDPETGDWEYFNLAVSAEGTTIVERGGAEVSNAAGSCLSCHAGAIERDYVCEQTGLCADAAIPRTIVDALVGDDQRCGQ